MRENPAETRTDLHTRREEIRAWCADHIPRDWRQAQTGVAEEEFVRFQKAWFAELHAAGYAVPHWPREWGGGMSVAEQIVLYQELAAHDAPRLVLAFVGIHHAASTLLVAGTDEQRRRHLPAILDGEIWVQGFSEPEAGSDLAALRTTARREGDEFVVNGQKLWASGGLHADWCLLLARTDPDAPKRKGISYFLLDMTSPGIDVRPIRNAVGDSHFCEIFLSDVRVPAANLVGAENAGWQVAQATLGAERGMTMLELAERLGNAGFRWLVQGSPVGDPVVADRLAQFEIELAGLRGMCRKIVEGHDSGATGPADASIVKLYYSELLQRMTDFGAEIGGLAGHTDLAKPMSSGWESGSWVLDFIGSWEWTIPGGSSEIQRTIIGERGLGLPREPSAV
ncbi:acyl-CoA dehydrogenase family protein [Mycolicibacterium arseniciresistens]|uniref:Acyl-CoA dehydrogenase family protein n=1 Tax=Mycolicibacterium arseniciresistens TaxID=3062257 RepID=A0ABT8UEP6_9MYCO|nr:acyl-CoA dehydrogenase family protein [Mycolicibacterium arseniciresistens]MDO3636259.1 acyl-CoA dehydrogenase family protein [Mycolicibacterium arseniciresistens]